MSRRTDTSNSGAGGRYERYVNTRRVDHSVSENGAGTKPEQPCGYSSAPIPDTYRVTIVMVSTGYEGWGRARGSVEVWPQALSRVRPSRVYRKFGVVMRVFGCCRTQQQGGGSGYVGGGSAASRSRWWCGGSGWGSIGRVRIRRAARWCAGSAGDRRGRTGSRQGGERGQGRQSRADR